MNEEKLFEEVSKVKETIEFRYNQSKEKVNEINKDKLFALCKEHGFDTKYLQENGLMFTYKMLIDLMMYDNVMNDFKINSIMELREKLEKLNEYEHRN